MLRPWTCGRCHNVNDARSPHCLRCGWAPMAQPTVMYGQAPRPRRRLPGWLLLVILGVVLSGAAWAVRTHGQPPLARHHWFDDDSTTAVSTGDPRTDELLRQNELWTKSEYRRNFGRVMPCGDTWDHLGGATGTPTFHYCNRGHCFIESQGTFVPWNRLDHDPFLSTGIRRRWP